MVTVKYEKIHELASLPEKMSDHAAGYDVRACLDSPVTLKPGERAAVATGLKTELPEDYVLSVRPRSGLAIKHGVTLINSPGTIDADFRGEIKILMVNLGTEPYTIENGERIAQFLLEKVYISEWVEASLSASTRGEGGFGSTGTV